MSQIMTDHNPILLSTAETLKLPTPGIYPKSTLPHSHAPLSGEVEHPYTPTLPSQTSWVSRTKRAGEPALRSVHKSTWEREMCWESRAGRGALSLVLWHGQGPHAPLPEWPLDYKLGLVEGSILKRIWPQAWASWHPTILEWGALYP